MDGWIDGWSNRERDGWVDKCVDGYKCKEFIQ